jgi:hypothetical protein
MQTASGVTLHPVTPNFEIEMLRAFVIFGVHVQRSSIYAIVSGQAVETNDV